MAAEEEVLGELPPIASWRLHGVHEGFEVARFARDDGARTLSGVSAGTEGGVPWTVRYVIVVSGDWHLRRARVSDLAGTSLTVVADADGQWTVDGEPRPDLEGCRDLDLEASVVTNTTAVHRLALSVGGEGESLAAYVRTDGLVVERLEQTYRRLPDPDGRLLFDYSAPRFGYRDTLRFGPDGLVVDYPGIGRRVGG